MAFAATGASPAACTGTGTGTNDRQFNRDCTKADSKPGTWHCGADTGTTPDWRLSAFGERRCASGLLTSKITRVFRYKSVAQT